MDIEKDTVSSSAQNNRVVSLKQLQKLKKRITKNAISKKATKAHKKQDSLKIAKINDHIDEIKFLRAALYWQKEQLKLRDYILKEGLKQVQNPTAFADFISKFVADNEEKIMKSAIESVGSYIPDQIVRLAVKKYRKFLKEHTN